MNKLFDRIVMCVGVAVIFFAIGAAYQDCAMGPSLDRFGKLKQECYPNKTCDDDLSCVSDVCVDAPAVLKECLGK